MTLDSILALHDLSHTREYSKYIIAKTAMQTPRKMKMENSSTACDNSNNYENT